jgi:hypothetical protein
MDNRSELCKRSADASAFISKTGCKATVISIVIVIVIAIAIVIATVIAR